MASAIGDSQYSKAIHDQTALNCNSFPVVDFSALSAGDPDRRSKAIHDLSKACEEWGFFIVVNHGVPEELINATFSAVKEFMSLGEDEKKQYEGKIGVDLHPIFHCPSKPQSLREVMVEYNERSKEVSRKLMEAISEGLQLEHHYVDEVLGLESSYQFAVANYYPVCPRPDQTIGIIPHTDISLFTLLMDNGECGLQIEHQGQWFNVHSPNNSIMVNISDQLEIFSNGRYKSLKHRVVVNEERERMSIAWQFGPSKEAVVAPAAALLDKQATPPMYRSIKYGDFIHRLFSNRELLSTYKLRVCLD